MKQSAGYIPLLSFAVIALFVLGCGAELGFGLHKVAEEVTVAEWAYPAPEVNQ